jgi:GYF domain 2
MRMERLTGTWYYRQDGQRWGPVSSAQLKELLTAGQIGPRMPVWKEECRGLLFVPAATAACGA